MAESKLGIWAVVRGGLITLVVVISWFDAMPLPELRRRDLRHPVAQEELERWSGVLQDMGHDVSKEELADFGVSLGGSAIRLRKALMGSSAQFRRVTGTGQSWGLFAYPDPYAGRLVVAARPRDGDWTTLWSAPAAAEDRLGARLRYRRIRGVYDDAGDRPNPSPLYDRFGAWIARQVFVEHPEVDQVEVRLDLVQVRTPNQAPAGPDERRHARSYVRDEVMP